ncbi:MAG: ATP-binding cassette domain-containing protein [Mariprofundaceae bacterium]|nr:ATP-binding cassette domain-containing protein [Mariprofundaceae bacterium]
MKHDFHLSYDIGALHLDVQAAFNDEIIVISGENGAGKSTLLRCLAGLESATGTIHINQRCWLDSSTGLNVATEQRGMGFVWPAAVALPWLTVEQNILLGAKHDDDKNVHTLCENFALHHLLGRRASMLSTGEAQRLALVRAMVGKPNLLLLDEPFSAQAPHVRRRFRAQLKTWQTQHNIPIIMVSHDAEDATSLAQQHWQMCEGQLKVKNNDDTNAF